MLCLSHALRRRTMMMMPKPLLARAPAVFIHQSTARNNVKQGLYKENRGIIRKVITVDRHTSGEPNEHRASPTSGLYSLHYQFPEGFTQVREREGPIEDFKLVAWDSKEHILSIKYGAEDMGARIPYIWLRDHCHCSECRNPDTLQRSVDTFSLSRDIHPISAEIMDEGIKIKWSHLDHNSFYDWHWLKTQVQGHVDADTEPKSHHYWGADIHSDPPTVAYEDVMASDEGVADWTAKIVKYGFCYVDGCPVSPEATKELLERISIIRETHYGGFYDFTSDLTMKDTAYTSLALSPHTDTTYFSEPVGLQAFHLLSHTEGEGGRSLLVDGVACSVKLKKENINAWNILVSQNVAWHASGNEGISIQPNAKFPVLETEKILLKESNETQYVRFRPGKVYRIRWNNDDRASSRPYGNIVKWYDAARLWNEMLHREENQYWEQLTPGRVLVFDNWRVLHGRSAFTGKRRMCGAYLNRDDFMSRWRSTNYTRKQVLERIV